MAASSITAETLASLYPFAEVDGHRLGQLLPLCHRERFRQSIDPFRQRDWHGQVIYLMRGELKVEQADGTIRVLVGGTDRALFPVAQAGQMPRSTKAITDIELLRIEEEASDIIVTWDQCTPGAERNMPAPEVAATDWRLMSGMFAIQTLTYGAFASLPPAHIATLLERFQRTAFKRGDVVISQGDAGDYYYLIEQGRCLVTRDVAGSTVELAELKAGDAFGEEALVSDSPRNASVTMRTDGVLLVLSKAEFNELLREPLLVNCPVAEAVQRTQRGAVWLDVRFAAEYQHDGLPKAINVPLNELRAAIPLLDKSREYIVYCQTGRRSAAAAFLLSQRGFNVVVLEGGLRALGELESKERG
jgi:rhodanese-related sulfurtransferase